MNGIFFCLIFRIKYYRLVIIHCWIKIWGYLFSSLPEPLTKYLFWGNIWIWGWMGLSWWDKGQGTGDHEASLSPLLRHSLSHPGRGRDLGSYVKPGLESLTASPSCFVSPCEWVESAVAMKRLHHMRYHQEEQGGFQNYKLWPERGGVLGQGKGSGSWVKKWLMGLLPDKREIQKI